MPATPLWGPIETLDGVVIPGPHGVSAASRVRPGTSSTVSIVADSGEAILVDAGRRTAPEYPPGVFETICEELDSRGLDLRYVFLTHFHYDHVGNAAALTDRYGATVCCHPADRAAIEDPLSIADTAFLERRGGDLETIARELALDSADDLIPSAEFVREHWNFPVHVDRVVENGDVLTVGDRELRVLETPGHTPGHCSLYAPGSKSLYLADVDYWPTPLHPYPVGDVAEQFASLQTCLALDAEYLFPGHGLPRSGSGAVEAYLEDALLRGYRLETRLLVVLGRHGPLAIPDIFAEAFVRKERYDYAVDGRYANGCNCIHAHLCRLAARGDVERVDRGTEIAWAVTERGRPPDDALAVEGATGRIETLADLRAANGRDV